MPAPKEYQGHRSRNAWNVALWIGNDESLYRLALECLKRAGGKRGIAARYFLREVGAERTPDGAKFNHLAVSLAMDGLT